jgi:hypothetical protein
MGLYDSFYASLTRPHYGCQASVEAQTQGVENAMLTFGIGEPVESLAQANFRGFAGCRWCDASVEVPILVREGRFIGFGGPALMSPAFGQLHFDQLPLCIGDSSPSHRGPPWLSKLPYYKRLSNSFGMSSGTVLS